MIYFRSGQQGMNEHSLPTYGFSFFAKSAIVLWWTFKYLINYELISAGIVRQGTQFYSFTCGYPVDWHDTEQVTIATVASLLLYLWRVHKTSFHSTLLHLLAFIFFLPHFQCCFLYTGSMVGSKALMRKIPHY